MDLYLYDEPTPTSAMLIVEAVVWAVVVVSCSLAVRRTWAWPGLAGGLLGLVASGAHLVDHVQVRAGGTHYGAHVFDSAAPLPDLPGFILDRGLDGELDWMRIAGLAFVALALVTAALLSRHGARPTSD